MNAMKVLMGAILACSTFAASAAVVNKTWTGSVVSGPFSGQIATGSFSYDSDYVFLSGPTDIGPLDGVSLEFNFLGQLFTEASDDSWPLTPTLSFQDGAPVSLDFLVSSGINNPQVVKFSTYALTMNGDGSYSSVINVTAVPEPETYALMLAGLALVGFAGKRRKLIA